ncbi:MAG: galactokinase [Gammaproteobacteria bacterium]|nr:galactokinase [Gammaproteobacteria bacterium]
MIDLARLRDAFRAHYGGEPRLFRAPGRVNLIGEHTDYNDGFVLPMAIDREVVVAAAARDDRRVRAFSLDLDAAVEFDLDRPGPKRRGSWLDYLEGVAQALEATGVRLTGAELAITSDVPVGAGLSSSAALEVAAGMALTSVSRANVGKLDLALAGQRAEHDYVGINCGIMDQFTSALARAGHALLIDCRSLEWRDIPLSTSHARVVICDSHVKHELAISAYNTRRAECESGVKLLNKILPDIRALRDVSTADFRRHEAQLPDRVRRRCRHVITENERTLAAANALSVNDFDVMGRLMCASHASMRDDYEISCEELDTLVEIAMTVNGVYGARMTGGGFGGCTVNVVARDALDRFREVVVSGYRTAARKAPTLYVSEAADGASEVRFPGSKKNS